MDTLSTRGIPVGNARARGSFYILGTQILQRLDQRLPKARHEFRGVDRPVFQAHMGYEESAERCRGRFGIGIEGETLFRHVAEFCTDLQASDRLRLAMPGTVPQLVKVFITWSWPIERNTNPWQPNRDLR